MLRTPVCDVLGIEAPIVQGAFGPWTDAELTAAISEAGALGSVGTATLSAERVLSEIRRVRDLTKRPFAVNFTARPFVEDIFEAVLRDRPAVISHALGDPGDLPARAHEVGARFVQQVHTVDHAEAAAARGVDVLIAQGSEAGGFGGTVGALALLPQVVDAVSPVPVLAAGGIADGRGLAAALLLGAHGVNIGTRFLASVEAAIHVSWKERILRSTAEDAVKVAFADAVFPPGGPNAYEVAPRVLRTAFVEYWNDRADEARSQADRLRAELGTAIAEGRAHELVPFTGQTVGLVDEVLPAAEIVRRLVAEAEELLHRAPSLAG
jgi:nitronate monooxygenase/enoyl-[acyl-carrier protein] reductase II